MRSASPVNARDGSVASAVALAGVGVFTLALVALHFLRPDYNPLTRFVSEYAVGQHGWVMKLAFVALSVGSAALLVALTRATLPRARSVAAMALLGLWSVCVLLAAIYDTDLLGAPDTRSGWIHGLSSLIAFVSLVAASFLLPPSTHEGPGGQRRARPRWLPVAMLLTFVLFIAAMAAVPQAAGLAQRIFLAVVLAWLFTLAADAKPFAAAKARYTGGRPEQAKVGERLP